MDAPRIAVFVTPHGFGHAARAAAILAELARGERPVRPEIFSTVPAWFFADALGPDGFGHHELCCDIGLVQRDPMHEDVPATLARLEAFVPFDPGLVRGLARLVRELGCAGVVADIAPLGLAVAAEAGLPSVLVENFTWDWIYRGYLDECPRLAGPADRMAEAFAGAGLRIQATPACQPCPEARTVAPVARPPRAAPERTRARLGVPAGRPLVLLTFGGMGRELAAPPGTASRSDLTFVLPGGAEQLERRGNLLLLPFRSGFYHPDLVAAADAVVGKLGYSTLAEAWTAGTPYGAIARPRFRESGPLSAFVEREMGGAVCGEAEIADGGWTRLLPALLSGPRPPRPATNGAAQAAGLIRAACGFPS